MINRVLTIKYGLLIFVVGLLFLLSFGLAGEMKKVENFSLKDYKGKSHSLTDYKDSPAIVVMFIATRCPVSNAYNSRMVDIYNDYSKKGITFLGINSNKQEGIDEVAEHSRENKFAFPVLKDDNNIIADKFDAQVTPEIYVLTPQLKLLYHGRIDDSQREGSVKSQDLRAALDEILAGKSVSTSKTKAFGCTIKRVKK